MVVFLCLGQSILQLFGLDVASFAVAGAIVIFIVAMEMILGINLIKDDPEAKGTSSVVPLAFPLIAGSGTLTTIISLKANYEQYTILLAILINLVIIFAVLKSLKFIERILGPTGLMAVRKFFGVVLLAIAVKIFATNAQGLIK